MRINTRSAIGRDDHEPIGRLFTCAPLGTLSPDPWDFSLWARGRIRDQATLYSYNVASCPWAGAALGLGPQTR
jgi:hypothetical protein